MAKLLYVIICSLAVQCAAEMGRQRRWRMERRKKAAAKAAAERREREKNAPRDAESTSDGTIANWRQRARAFGLNPPDEDNSTKTVANATAAVPLAYIVAVSSVLQPLVITRPQLCKADAGQKRAP